ncbi:DUF1573 domain-containing protein [Palleniella muris]|uniref:DUF1573 domain-containing protein n=1 Tax=Palleniella muris TaxID=3038145 RepID=A0AC61QM76_9BACT|nr:DUF1573 domain-containing protein [Palleniella muris]TGX80445.1 DUF1573 domain-containing protein [Palleniella muris]
MKKILFTMLMMLAFVATASAQAKIKFDKTVHNFGQFSETDSKQSCVFTFTNVGDKPLVVNQALASCGCTAPKYTKTPVMPGEKGELKVVYNGAGRMLGHFKKTITVRTNGTPEVVRLYIEGDMTEDKK